MNKTLKRILISLLTMLIIGLIIIFGINLYEAGIGDKIEEMFVEEIAGKGAVRNTLKKYL